MTGIWIKSAVSMTTASETLTVIPALPITLDPISLVNADYTTQIPLKPPIFAATADTYLILKLLKNLAFSRWRVSKVELSRSMSLSAPIKR